MSYKTRHEKLLDVWNGKIDSTQEYQARLARFKYRWSVSDATRQTPPWHKSKIIYVAPDYYSNGNYGFMCSLHEMTRIEYENYRLKSELDDRFFGY